MPVMIPQSELRLKGSHTDGFTCFFWLPPSPAEELFHFIQMLSASFERGFPEFYKLRLNL
jgi:hypothetical protein